MKRCILETNLEGQGGKQHCLPIFWFSPGGWDIFEKGGTSEKEIEKIEVWNGRLRLLCPFCIGVSRKFHLH